MSSYRQTPAWCPSAKVRRPLSLLLQTPGTLLRSLCLLPLLCLPVLPAVTRAAEPAAAPVPAAAQEQSALSLKQQSIIPIAAFCAQGAQAKLTAALHEGLNNGLTISEIREVLVQMYAYAGFPRSLTGLTLLMNVLDERRAQGREDVMGRDATPLPADADLRALGTANQTAVIGRPASGRVYDFAPVIDTFLKEHLFADIFGRDVLTFHERELATVSALAALPAPAQLRSHLNCCLVVGLTMEELQAFVQVLAAKVGSQEADLARTCLAAVSEARAAEGR